MISTLSRVGVSDLGFAEDQLKSATEGGEIDAATESAITSLLDPARSDDRNAAAAAGRDETNQETRNRCVSVFGLNSEMPPTRIELVHAV